MLASPSGTVYHDSMSRIGAGIVVFISGAAILALEILGTRILGPFYGVSLYLWSALISVTLLALAAGYAAGGRWADRDPRASRLTPLLAGAGLWLVVIPWMRTPLLHLVEPLGLRAAVLVAATLLFAPPLTLLGMVSPFTVRLRTGTIGEVGRTAGDLFAISTVAGVLAALATGFWLIPVLGVAALTRIIAAFLLVAAAVAQFEGRITPGAASNERIIAPVLLLAATACGGLAAIGDAPGRERPAGLLANRESSYGEIRVVEHDAKRYLLIDGGIHSIVAPDTWWTYFAYVPVMDIPRFFFDTPGRALLVGLGGASVAKR